MRANPEAADDVQVESESGVERQPAGVGDRRVAGVTPAVTHVRIETGGHHPSEGEANAPKEPMQIPVVRIAGVVRGEEMVEGVPAFGSDPKPRKANLIADSDLETTAPREIVPTEEARSRRGHRALRVEA